MGLYSIADNLNETDEKKLVNLLDKIGPKMPTPVYNAVAAKFVLVAIETVILRRKAGKVEVFLTKRPENDEYYPNMLHSPGTILRASDRPGSYLDAFERVQKNELGVDFMSPPKFGRFYDARNLPDDLVPHHYILIAKVLDHYPRP